MADGIGDNVGRNYVGMYQVLILAAEFSSHLHRQIWLVSKEKFTHLQGAGDKTTV